jgi:hypothetical protein
LKQKDVRQKNGNSYFSVSHLSVWWSKRALKFRFNHGLIDESAQFFRVSRILSARVVLRFWLAAMIITIAAASFGRRRSKKYRFERVR